MKTAYAYLRVSGKGQVEGDGFTRQLEAVKAYATTKGIKVAKTFREEGVSGTKDWDNRKAFVEMMTLLLSNGTRTVLVESLSRLARDLMIQESIIADFKRKGLELVSVTEPDMCSGDPSRDFIRQVLGAFHQYDKALLVSKLRGARQRMRAKTGHCEGRKPYGCHDGEKLTLERMKTLRAAKTPVDTIAAILNADNVKTRSGGQWYGATVNKILKAQTS